MKDKFIGISIGGDGKVVERGIALFFLMDQVQRLNEIAAVFPNKSPRDRFDRSPLHAEMDGRSKINKDLNRFV